MKRELIIYDTKINSGSSLFINIESQLILDRFIELIENVSFKKVIFCTEEIERVEKAVEERLGRKDNIEVANVITPSGRELILKANCLYDKGKLIKIIRKGNSDISSAVLWELKNKDDIKNAEDVLERIRVYLIARYINLKVAKWLCKFFVKSKVTPNHLTLISLLAGIIASLCFASGSYPFIVSGVFLLQLHCTLDFADGYLARIKGLISNFGTFFDNIVNKIVEGFCYIGISYSVLVKYNSLFFSIVSLWVILGYFMIPCMNFFKEKMLNSRDYSYRYSKIEDKVWFKITKRIYGFFETWDVRLYVISIFALINRLEIALIYFAVDFNARWMFNSVRIILKGFRRNSL
jgi:phosphatidylglycerophosphate synthase